MANIVTVSDTVPGWTPPAAQPYVQIDAPSGYCVVSVYGDPGSTPTWNVGGLAGAFEVITDGDDLVTGVIFTNSEYGPSYTGFVQCLEIVP